MEKMKLSFVKFRQLIAGLPKRQKIIISVAITLFVLGIIISIAFMKGNVPNTQDEQSDNNIATEGYDGAPDSTDYYKDGESITRDKQLPDHFTCGDSATSFGENAILLCGIPVNGKTDAIPVDNASDVGNLFPYNLKQIENTAGIVITPGTGMQMKPGAKAKVEILQYAYTTKNIIDPTKPDYDSAKWQLATNTWENPVNGLTVDVTVSAADSQFISEIGYIFNGQNVGTVFISKIITSDINSTNPTPPIIMIGTVIEANSPENRDIKEDPSFPKPSYSIPENMPSLSFSDKGAPDKLTIPDGFKMPSELTVKVISEGNGIQVDPHDSVLLNYVGWTTDGKKVDDSYKYGATEALDLQNAMKGLAGSISGQKIGSKLLVLIPSDLAFGSGDAIYFIEILGIK